MRVLEIYDVDGTAGASRVARRISQGLRYRGHVVMRMHAGQCREGDEALVHPGCVDPSLMQMVSLCRFIRHVVSVQSVQVIHAHHRRLALVAKLAVRGTEVPIAEHVHSVFADRRTSSFRSDAVLCLTERLRNDVELRYPHTVGKTHLCHNGVTIPSMISAAPNHETIRLLGVGRVEDAKRPAAFVEIVSGLRTLGLDVEGTWLGEGPMLEQMRSSSEFCSWPGAVDRVGEWIQAADCLVSTSDREGVPLSILEAMAEGRPILARRAGGISELVDEQVGVAWDGTEAWASVISRIAEFLGNRDGMRLAGQLAHERVAAAWTEDGMVDRVEEILEGLLQ